ncbi:MAG: hypothetical protein HYT71_03850 [Candidatus Aenigmarchaeota archaeon]|nr:hypothetical protein [Candidatus Aenigmarchaeota archaeon]
MIKKHYNLSALLIIAVVLISGCVSADSIKKPYQQTQNENETFPQNEPNKFAIQPSCGSDNILFSVSPAPLDKVLTLTPVGAMSPPDHVLPAPHMYFYVIDWKNQKDSEVPVYASGNMVLKQIGLRHYNHIGQYYNYIDYTLVFSPCAEFDLYFHHLRTLTYQPFIDAANKILQTCSFSKDRNEDYCSGVVNIPVEAGQQIATAGDLKGGVYGFDLGARDYRLPTGKTALLNPDRFCKNGYTNPFDRCYAVCPFDYFTDEVKSQIKYSMDGQDGLITNLSCGTLFTDVKDSLQGYWFKKGSSPMTIGESDGIYIGPDNTNPNVKVISVGNTLSDIQSGKYNFKPLPSGIFNRDPEYVTADGNIYCYEVNRGDNLSYSIIMQLTNSASLRIEKLSSKNCGSGPWSFYSSYTDYER